jgi:primosomal protein N' (replication factor Y) (superfamily II helicase)
MYAEVAFNLPVKRNFTYRIPDGVDVSPGYRVSAPFGRRSLTGSVVALREAPPEGVSGIRDLSRVVDARRLFGDETLELARWMSQMYLCSLGEALSAILPGGRREGEADELPPEEDLREYELAPRQQEAIQAITSRTEGSFYLFGVTGSGKTDVFLRVAREVTARGRGVIYLVPEISLTHQIVRVFRSLYKDRLAILHSALTPSQRLREWLRVMSGEVDVAIGARSAVFAPFPKLGLIVIDEEHEGSYKSSATPRYHARQVAMYRAGREKAILLMGSATPSVEAWHHMEEGKLASFRLPERLSGGSMPKVEIVDMHGQEGPLSARLLDEIARTHGEGRQSILFLNRRGFSYFFHCRSCGYEMTCTHCSVPLTYHKGRGRMICHYCGFSSAPIRTCPECGSLDVGYSGFGTEGIEEALQAQFPQVVVRRVDTDAVKKKRVLRQTLADFRQGRIHVLIGTQMVAKGLDFPGVKLVGIVNADTGFQMPDFRAAERTFGLLVQVSGRAGRSLPDGKVLIQTFRPETPAIVLAAGARLEEFYAREIDTRRQLGFPPFCRLIRVVLRGKDREKTQGAAAEVAKALTTRLGASAEVLGPVECPISRISGNYRFHALIRMQAFTTVREGVAEVLDAYRAPSGIHVEVDVDPQALL